MRIKVDENLHADVAALLTTAGNDVQTVFAEGLRGCDDLSLAEHGLFRNLRCEFGADDTALGSELPN